MVLETKVFQIFTQISILWQVFNANTVSTVNAHCFRVVVALMEQAKRDISAETTH